MEQANAVSFEKLPRREKARRMESVFLSEAEKNEFKRRLRINELGQRARELDNELFREIIRPAETLGESLMRIETVESMRDGKELEWQELGVSGVNETTRRVYEGNPPCVAYVKPQLGEASFEHDTYTGEISRVQRVLNNDTGMVEKKYETIKETMSAQSALVLENYLTLEFANRETLIKEVAKHYGVEAEDVPLKPESRTMRTGVDVEKGAIREYIASRINELVGFGVVPLTVLRAEEDLSDMSSVQEAARSSDPERPVRNIELEDLQDLRIRGKEHPMAKSFIRIACLDYLIGSTDRHGGNLLIDPVGQKCIAIDNSYSLGLCKTVEGKSKMLDPFVSVPLDIMMMEKDWKLDDEALGELKRIYDSIQEYIFMRESRKDAEYDIDKLDYLSAGAGKGKEIKYISKLFRMLYGNEKIAKREALKFMDRVEVLITLGRPPQLGEDELWHVFTEDDFANL